MSSGSQFALVHINGNLCLAQIPGPSSPGSAASALSVVDVDIFAHEFINIFRFSHRATVHPADIQVVTPIDGDSVCCDEDNERIFLSKDVMEHFSTLTARRPVKPIRRSRMRYAHRSGSSPTPQLSPALTPTLAQFPYPVR